MDPYTCMYTYINVRKYKRKYFTLLYESTVLIYDILTGITGGELGRAEAQPDNVWSYHRASVKP
jgi:hypothetical protein